MKLNLFDDFIINTYSKTGYPFYDVYKLDTGYSLELALAGFEKEEIDTYLDNGYVHIEGKRKRDPDEPKKQTLVSGIAKRDFNVKYKVPEYHKVDMVIFDNGVLKIWMVEDIPSHMKRKPLLIE